MSAINLVKKLSDLLWIFGKTIEDISKLRIKKIQSYRKKKSLKSLFKRKKKITFPIFFFIYKLINIHGFIPQNATHEIVNKLATLFVIQPYLVQISLVYD